MNHAVKSCIGRLKMLAGPVRDEYRLPLRSLVGHRSQAPEKIRNAMGRNLPDFIRFLRAHSDVFVYDPVTDTVKLTSSAQISPRDCPSPASSISSFSSQSIPASDFDSNECLEFIALILQHKGPLFLDELYGHLNKKYKPDVRQHFAKNPRELGEMLQQKGGNKFNVAGNLVTYLSAQSPQEAGAGSVRSPPGSAREGMKLRLAQTLSKVVSDNKARGALPEPETDNSTCDLRVALGLYAMCRRVLGRAAKSVAPELVGASYTEVVYCGWALWGISFLS